MWSAWLRAARLPSQTYLAFPLLLGQLAAATHLGQWSWLTFLLLHLYGLAQQCFIVFANDWADEVTDRDNRTATLFSGGSRVLVEGRLTSRALLMAACVMLLLALLLALVMSMLAGQPLLLLLALVGAALMWAYSFPPLRLSYRGGGELLQMLGLGAVLPAMGWLAQGGTLAALPWPLLALLMLLALVTAVASSLPDTPSDARAGKQTLAVRYGLAPARRFAIVVLLGTLALYVSHIHGLLPVQRLEPWPLVGPSALAALACVLLARRAIPGAPTMAWFVFALVFGSLALQLALVIALTWLSAAGHPGW